MKFSVGDKMLIKKTGEEGVVVSLIDKDMAEVLVAGTTFPIYIAEIDHPYLSWFTKKNKETQKSKKLREQIPQEPLIEKKLKIASGIHLLFMPIFGVKDMEEVLERLKIFLVNETHYTIELKYAMRTKDLLDFSFQGLIHPFSDVYLHFAEWETMQNIPRFDWSIRETINKEFVEKSDQLKIRSSKLFAQINELQVKNVATFQYTLLEDFEIKKIIKPIEKLERIVPKTNTKIRSIQDIPKYEIDLHIEKITDNQSGMSNGEKLQLQINFLEKYLQLAIIHRQEKMLIIHGIGMGVLRSEVEKHLQKNKFVHRTETGYQGGYGFGATVAYFQYS